MHFSQFQAAACLAWVAFVSGTFLPRPHISATIDYNLLATKLSADALIYLPGTDLFDDAVARWSNVSTPVANIVVLPSTEADVVAIVKFANCYSIPFLTTNSVHGSISTLGKMTFGIEIHMSQLNSITIDSTTNTATIGGGVLSHNLTDTLWAAGKQTVTGTCECVSYLGPGLGGGHGWLQGRHGLVADQFVSWNVVLANGTLITVDANSDLFYAMKGAGHNFGIVTSMTSTIYDIERPNYAMTTINFSGDQVEDVYRVANEQWLTNGTEMPVDLINWSYWFYDPTTDAEKPIIQFYIIQEGVDVVNEAHTAPFLALGAISNTTVSGTYKDLGAWTGISLTDGPCQKTGNANPRFPIYLKQYDPAAQAAVYELFKQATTNDSTPFSQALFMFEGYSSQGVKAISEDTTAFAYRADNLLVAPLLTYASTGAASDKVASDLGNKIRNILYEASGETTLNTYVNYAYGDETAEAWYGADATRQSRLKALKTKYDPNGRFSFYAPIA